MPKWKRGRGKLGPLEPLLGSWVAEVDSPIGRLKCTRTFAKIGGEGKWVILVADWDFGGKHYVEQAIYGVGDDGELGFWSFTSDGKRSVGHIADGTDIHPETICFEAQMPAGLARMVYWPGDNDTINWAVESKTKKGWNRFTLHNYKEA